jgi:glycerophosphoryl diester phosphodiesterase
MLAIAHRGASAYAPENTRPAFERAIEIGANMIETDVQITRDGELVLFHDDIVDRTSDGVGPLADHTLDELRRLDIGAWMGSEFAGERIVTLDEFWDSFVPRITVCLEIKDPLATDSLVRFLSENELADRVQVTSFSWSPATRAKSEIDGPIGFVCRHFNEDILDRCVARGIVQVCPPVAELSVERVQSAHERGLDVRAWGIRQRSDIDRLFETGADGATCDSPDWITNHASYTGRSQR